MNALTPVERRVSPLAPQTFTELVQFAERAARSSMVPKDYIGKPENILLAVQMGAELGLPPMQSLQNISVVNGRPAVWGDAMPGLCRQSSVCDDIEEWIEGEGDNMTAFCRATRHGKKPVTAKFSVADAKKAGLWAKQGTWAQYPQRMLVWRARSWALRDAFPDVLRGLMAVEEARDIPAEPFNGTTIDAAPEPAGAAPDAPTAEAKPRRTINDWLAAFALAARDVQSAEAANALICGEESLQMKEHLTAKNHPGLERYTAIVSGVLQTWFSEPPADEDVVPEMAGSA